MNDELGRVYEQLESQAAELTGWNKTLEARSTTRCRSCAPPDMRRPWRPTPSARIERDLHDGAQQHLVWLAVQLELARELAVTPTRREAKALLDELDAEFRRRSSSFRDLAHGIYPPLLQDRGLATPSRAPHAGRRCRALDAARLGRYPTQRSRQPSTSAASRRFRTPRSTPARRDRTVRCGRTREGCSSRSPTTAPASTGHRAPGVGLTNMSDRSAQSAGSLPSRPSPGAERRSQDRSHSAPDPMPRALRVLVADDQAPFRRAARAVLEDGWTSSSSARRRRGGGGRRFASFTPARPGADGHQDARHRRDRGDAGRSSPPDRQTASSSSRATGRRMCPSRAESRGACVHPKGPVQRGVAQGLCRAGVGALLGEVQRARPLPDGGCRSQERPSFRKIEWINFSTECSARTSARRWRLRLPLGHLPSVALPRREISEGRRLRPRPADTSESTTSDRPRSHRRDGANRRHEPPASRRVP